MFYQTKYPMYLQIKTAKLVPDAYWHRIEITKVGLYDSDGKFTKWVKLNDVVLQDLVATKIQPNLFNTYQHTDDE